MRFVSGAGSSVHTPRTVRRRGGEASSCSHHLAHSSAMLQRAAHALYPPKQQTPPQDGVRLHAARYGSGGSLRNRPIGRHVPGCRSQQRGPAPPTRATAENAILTRSSPLPRPTAPSPRSFPTGARWRAPDLTHTHAPIVTPHTQSPQHHQVRLRRWQCRGLLRGGRRGAGAGISRASCASVGFSSSGAWTCIPSCRLPASMCYRLVRPPATNRSARVDAARCSTHITCLFAIRAAMRRTRGWVEQARRAVTWVNTRLPPAPSQPASSISSSGLRRGGGLFLRSVTLPARAAHANGSVVPLWCAHSCACRVAGAAARRAPHCTRMARGGSRRHAFPPPVPCRTERKKSPPLRRSPLELMLEAGWDGAGGSVSRRSRQKASNARRVPPTRRRQHS
jgi:hypothetical protein